MRWGTIWLLLGAIAGLLMARRDSGHMPAYLLPVVTGVAGAVAGLLGSLILLVARHFFSDVARPGRWRAMLVAAAAGVLSMTLLAALLGVPLPLAMIAGAVAGMISGALTA